MVPVRVSRLAMDGTAGTNLVVLQEVQGDRMLPIWIGRAEAEAIARHLEGVSVERPLTHDLAQSMVASLGGAIASVRVTHVSESTFFAEIILSCGNEQRVVDARPSDAIALAIRANAPIFAAEALLAHYPVLSDAGDAPGESADAGGYQSPSATGTPDSAELQRYLEQMRPEDFGKFRP